MIQANVRSDASSRFADGYRWGTFPSVSAGWVISKEDWFDVNVIDFLKVRASIGQLGNERIGSEFPYAAALSFSNVLIPNTGGTVDVEQTAYQSTYAFKDITWETTTTYGAGLDMRMFDSRLTLSADWYYKKTEDMLLTIGFPSYFGFNAPENNAADMYTIGWDLELGWNDNVGDFNYGANFNISDYRSRMGYMADRQSISNGTITEEGSYYQEWYGFRSNGIILNQDAMKDANGNTIPLYTAKDKPGCLAYQDIDGDGQITQTGDRVYLGNSLPELIYGGNLWAEWRGIDLSMSFSGVGHQLKRFNFCGTAFNNSAYAAEKERYDYRWSPHFTDEQNAKAKYPMLTTANTTNTNAHSDFWLFNGGYFRMKNITLGYTLPESITPKSVIQKVRFYASVNDLPAISNYPKGYDPEWSNWNEFIMTSYVLGVNVTF
jgi:TonB-linked SusC/RagA family outer membrane protein